MIIGRFDLGKTPLILAPMEEITDYTFRGICRELGADLTISEFISAEALVRKAEKSLIKMRAAPWDTPRVVQIFGNKPDSMAEAARIVVDLGADIVDLNFGCPVRKIVSKGGGSALLRDLPLMNDISKAVVKAVNVPVTAKTRLGWDEQNIVVENVALMLQDAGIAALAIHARTRSQMYGGLADWSYISKVKSLNGFTIPLIGNGDLDSPSKVADAFRIYQIDAAMIGRAAIGNPYIFKNSQQFLQNGIIPEPSKVKTRVDILLRHLNESMAWKPERRAVIEMRKHVSAYFRGLNGFKPFKLELMQTTTKEDFVRCLDKVKIFYAEDTDGE